MDPKKRGPEALAARRTPNDLDEQQKHGTARNVRRQHLARLLHQSGPRPMFEALLEVERGRSLDSVLERYAEIPPHVYCALGANVLPIDHMRAVCFWAIQGGRST
jgi:hypothetical protein